MGAQILILEDLTHGPGGAGAGQPPKRQVRWVLGLYTYRRIWRCSKPKASGGYTPEFWVKRRFELLQPCFCNSFELGRFRSKQLGGLCNSVLTSEVMRFFETKPGSRCFWPGSFCCECVDFYWGDGWVSTWPFLKVVANVTLQLTRWFFQGSWVESLGTHPRDRCKCCRKHGKLWSSRREWQIDSCPKLGGSCRCERKMLGCYEMVWSFSKAVFLPKNVIEKSPTVRGRRSWNLLSICPVFCKMTCSSRFRLVGWWWLCLLLICLIVFWYIVADKWILISSPLNLWIIFASERLRSGS